MNRPFIGRTPNRSFLLFALGSDEPFRDMQPSTFSPDNVVHGPSFTMPSMGTVVVSYRNGPTTEPCGSRAGVRARRMAWPTIWMTLMCMCEGWEVWGSEVGARAALNQP